MNAYDKTVDQLEGDIDHLTEGLKNIAKADPQIWGGEIPLVVQKFAQEILDTRWENK